MKLIVAAILVIVSMVAAEAPNSRINYARQSAASPPYVAREWRQNARLLNLPQQVYGAPQPAPSYGPPPQEEAESITTESNVATTTEGFAEESLAENIEIEPKSGKIKSARENLEEGRGQLYVVLPQGQNLLYATGPKSAALVSAPSARVQVFPYSAVSSSVFTPYSASFIQIYQ